MSTAKHSKSLNGPFILRNRSSIIKTKTTSLPYTISMLVGSLVGTYLDLYFTGKKIYSFPNRPLADVFTIDICFTLIGLPIFIFLFLFIMKKLTTLPRFIFVLTATFSMSIMEQTAEYLGWFTHQETWKHSYSFIGYFLFIWIIWFVFRWTLHRTTD